MSIHSASPVDNAENQGPLLRVDKVSLEYKTPERRVRATHQVSFDVHASERFILLGPSGCGKSTLLKAVAGFIKPTEGRIALDDRPVQGPGPDRVVVFQEFDQLPPWKTLRQNVAFPLIASASWAGARPTSAPCITWTRSGWRASPTPIPTPCPAA